MEAKSSEHGGSIYLVSDGAYMPHHDTMEN